MNLVGLAGWQVNPKVRQTLGLASVLHQVLLEN